MSAIKVEIIDPRAIDLLRDLARMNLIKITGDDVAQASFLDLVARLRSEATDPPSLEEIAEEVETLRTLRTKENG